MKALRRWSEIARVMSDGSVMTYRIRPLLRADRPRVREICVATAWLGEAAPERIVDGYVWAEYWTRYFTDRERRNSWVVEGGPEGPVVGYLTGTADVRRFERYVPYLLPGSILHVVRKRLLRRSVSRKAILGLLGSLARGEMALPAGVVEAYPATFHMNLLPGARRQGVGSRLFRGFAARMRSLGVPGVHLQTLSVNVAIQRFCRRAGFRLVASEPLHAFTHVDPRPVEVRTWTLGVSVDLPAASLHPCSTEEPVVTGNY